MDSPMLKMIKQQNPYKKYPIKLGEKWTIEEENILLLIFYKLVIFSTIIIDNEFIATCNS